ncbi:MAG: hypothetical protein MZW92_56320, partial [Comamonadaceae bacterium]|nr:hypothetical protein [Comamonadaceae bacterium]
MAVPSLSPKQAGTARPLSFVPFLAAQNAVLLRSSAMTTPEERTRTLLNTKAFLQELTDPSQTPGVPEDIRRQARHLLRHYQAAATSTWRARRCRCSLPSAVDSVVSRLFNLSNARG